MKPAPNEPCPCGTGRKYKQCCRPLHRGAAPATAEALMRSRYTAYVAGEVDYILATTHPDGPHHQSDRQAWSADVRAFCERTTFTGLEVREAGGDEEEAWVTFRASLSQGGHDGSFVERSTFRRVDGRWTYHSGEPRPA